MMMYETLYKIGIAFRNPSMFKLSSFLKESDTWKAAQLKEYQLERLKFLVDFAYKNSTYYKEKFDSVNFSPSDLSTLEDLSKIPFLGKTDVLAHNTKIHTSAASKTFTAITSGSTGESLAFKRDEHADSFNRASAFRGYSWYGVKPWEKNGYFWGFNFSFSKRIKTRFLDTLQNRFRLFSYQKEPLHSFVKKLKKTKYLHGYSSMIYHTAKLINSNSSFRPADIKMVKGTSEKIFDNYHEEVKKAFGSKIISEYGATESGIIAFECPEGNMHINMEGVLVEEIDHEIVVTNLQMTSFPIIRYKLGDYIQLAPESKQCKCGRKHRILEEVTGRIGKIIYGKIGEYPSFSFYYIFKNLSNTHNIKLNYQIVQNERGKLDVRIEQVMTRSEKQKLKEEFLAYFNEDISYTLKDGIELQTSNGKLKSFISHL